MKITKPQIEDLYAFTRNHYVEYHDLQTELVDHLANDIEQMWIELPQLSFEEAKTKAFKKFGVFGFMEPIEQKQKAMNKKMVCNTANYNNYMSVFSVLYFIFNTIC